MPFLKLFLRLSSGFQSIFLERVLFCISWTTFFFFGPTKDQCKRDLDNFVLLCNYLGVPLAPDKTAGPDTALPFAGITLDSVRMEARLPEEKLQKCRNLLTDFPSRLKELQSLIGLLNFTCFVVVAGRAFLRHLIDLTKGITKPHYHIRISRGAKQDLTMWLQFLTEFNDRSFFLYDIWETSQTLQRFTDAAGSTGFGAVFGAHWFQGLWPTTARF